MCGIFGWQWRKNNLPSRERRAAIAMLLGHFNTSRGKDSYGWYDNYTGEIVRGVGSISAEARHMRDAISLIGHTRHATTGSKTVENSHPFEIGHIIGAHNGTVGNHDSLNKSREVKYEVDSMHIFHGLNAGIGLDGVFGYGSIEWVDDRVDTNQILLCRITSNADLAVSVIPNGVIWSSSLSSLIDVCEVVGLKPKMIMEIENSTVFSVVGGDIFETDRKLSFGWLDQKKTEKSNNSAGTYGSSQMRSARDLEDDYEKWWQRNYPKEGSSELDKMDVAAAWIAKNERAKTIGPRPTAPTNDRGCVIYPFSQADIETQCGYCYSFNDEHERWCHKR